VKQLALTALLLTGCGGALCEAPACRPEISVSLVDAAGQPLAPQSGTLTIGEAVQSFDCTVPRPRKGPNAVSCTPAGLTLFMDDYQRPAAVHLTVRAAGSAASFSGVVELSYVTTRETCAGACEVASPKVTLR